MVHYHAKHQPVAAAELNADGELRWDIKHAEAHCRNCRYLIIRSELQRDQQAQAKGFCCVGCMKVYSALRKRAATELGPDGELQWQIEPMARWSLR